MMSRPDSRGLKSYYTVEQVKEQMRGRNIAETAKTILREPVANAVCPEWVFFEGVWATPSYVERIKKFRSNQQKMQ
ncbi:MAG: hypothetical protein WC736_14325, partial [Gallionella sp.]|jgi:hypothetical protein